MNYEIWLTSETGIGNIYIFVKHKDNKSNCNLAITQGHMTSDVYLMPLAGFPLALCKPPYVSVLWELYDVCK